MSGQRRIYLSQYSRVNPTPRIDVRKFPRLHIVAGTWFPSTDVAANLEFVRDLETVHKVQLAVAPGLASLLTPDMLPPGFYMSSDGRFISKNAKTFGVDISQLRRPGFEDSDTAGFTMKLDDSISDAELIRLFSRIPRFYIQTPIRRTAFLRIPHCTETVLYSDDGAKTIVKPVPPAGTATAANPSILGPSVAIASPQIIGYKYWRDPYRQRNYVGHSDFPIDSMLESNYLLAPAVYGSNLSHHDVFPPQDLPSELWVDGILPDGRLTHCKW